MIEPKTIEALTNAVLQAAAVELGGIKLELPNPALLDVREMDLEAHLALQPAGTYYYGAMKREAARTLAVEQRKYERWRHHKRLAARRAVEVKQHRATLEDVDIRFTVDNEKEIIEWEDRIEKLQGNLDLLESWFDSWKQKSFSLREFVTMSSDELNSPSTVTVASISAQEQRRERLASLRNRLAKKDGSAGQAGS